MEEKFTFELVFPILPYFEGVYMILTKVTCLVWVDKHIVMILRFLSSCWCIMAYYIPSKLREKPLCQLEKGKSTHDICSFAKNAL